MVLTHSRIYIYTVYNYMYIIILIMYSTCFFTKSKLFIISGDLGTAASLRSEEGKPCWRTGTRRSPCAVWRPRENPMVTLGGTCMDLGLWHGHVFLTILGVFFRYAFASCVSQRLYGAQNRSVQLEIGNRGPNGVMSEVFQLLSSNGLKQVKTTDGKHAPCFSSLNWLMHLV